MLFFFAAQEELAKQPAPGYSPKQLIAKTGPLPAKPVTNAIPAFLLMKALR